MSLYVAVRAEIAGEPHDLWIEVRSVDLVLSDAARPVALLDDFSILRAVGDPEPIPVEDLDDEDALLAAVEDVIQEACR